MTPYLHDANCYFGLTGGLRTQLVPEAEVSEPPVLWQSFRPRGGGSTLTHNLAKRESLENILASSD